MDYSKKSKNRIISSVLNDDLLSKIDWKVLLFSALINVLFQLKDSTSSVFGYLGVAAMILSLVFVKRENHLYLFMAVISGNRLFSFLGIPFLNVFTAVYFFENYLFFGSFKEKKISSKLLLPFIVIVAFSLHFLIDEGSFRDIMIFVKIFLTFIILLDSVEECETAEELKDKIFLISIYFSFGMAISCLIPLLAFSQSSNMVRFSMSEKSGENPLGILLGVGIAFNMVLVFKNRSRMFNILTIILILPMIYIGTLTQSRSFIFILLMTLAWLLFFGIINKQTRKTVLIVGLILTIISILFWKRGENLEFHKVIEACVNRIVNPKNDDISNGRTDIWKVYMESFLNNKGVMFFGADRKSMGISMMAHNMFMEVLYGYGIVGTALIAWFFGAFISSLYKKFKELGFKKISLFGALPLLMMIAGGVGSHSFLGTQPILEMFFGLCTMFCSEARTVDIKRKRSNTARYPHYYRRGESI